MYINDVTLDYTFLRAVSTGKHFLTGDIDCTGKHLYYIISSCHAHEMV